MKDFTKLLETRKPGKRGKVHAMLSRWARENIVPHLHYDGGWGWAEYVPPPAPPAPWADFRATVARLLPRPLDRQDRKDLRDGLAAYRYACPRVAYGERITQMIAFMKRTPEVRRELITKWRELGKARTKTRFAEVAA